MPMNTTTYRFRLPDGQVYGGHDTEAIFRAHPDAAITHQTTWNDNGDETESVLLDPPLRAPDPAPVIEHTAEVEPERETEPARRGSLLDRLGGYRHERPDGAPAAVEDDN